MSDLIKLKDLDSYCNKLIGQKLFGIVLGLEGELGTGKTTFTAALLSSLGVSVPVTSPSYTLCHEYALADKNRIEHWDLYRLNSVPEELLDPPDADTLVIIEWIDKFPEIHADLRIRFNYTDPPKEDTRLLELINC